MKQNFTFIDLFAGCGGLTEGFYREEEIENAVMCDDITREGLLEDMDQRVSEEVDIIIGGPPCQAFSSVGRAQDPNSMSEDPRNYLFENYLEVLNHYKPKMFIFENVKGLLTAHPKGVDIFDLIIRDMSKTYKVVSNKETILLNAVNYGVPQNRERVILCGIRNDIDVEPEEFYKKLIPTHSVVAKEGLKPAVTVREAIADLPKLLPGEGTEIIDFNETKFNDYLLQIRRKDFGKLYQHVARKHNENDRERYRILSEHGNWQLKDLAEVRPDLVHHDPKHFGNRYTVQEWDKPGRTVVAHLYKDGNLFIHPDSVQERTFTVREAARIQSFPDDFFFEGSRTEQFKQVGNAVPPLMAEAFAVTMKEMLSQKEMQGK